MLSLIESGKLNGHDLWVYLKDVFERLPTLNQAPFDNKAVTADARWVGGTLTSCWPQD